MYINLKNIVKVNVTEMLFLFHVIYGLGKTKKPLLNIYIRELIFSVWKWVLQLDTYLSNQYFMTSRTVSMCAVHLIHRHNYHCTSVLKTNTGPDVGLSDQSDSLWCTQYMSIIPLKYWNNRLNTLKFLHDLIVKRSHILNCKGSLC